MSIQQSGSIYEHLLADPDGIHGDPDQYTQWPEEIAAARVITVGARVIFKGDPRPGVVVELWAGKRAQVRWQDSDAPNWVAIDSLRLVQGPQGRTYRSLSLAEKYGITPGACSRCHSTDNWGGPMVDGEEQVRHEGWLIWQCGNCGNIDSLTAAKIATEAAKGSQS